MIRRSGKEKHTRAVGCGLLAGLSKANGFLLPLLVVTLNASVLRAPTAAGTGSHTAMARARLLLATVPALLIVLLLFIGAGYWGDFAEREWTLSERLLTQPRALWDYLYRLAVPGISATGVFADGYKASSGLLTPPSTALAIAALATVAVLAWRCRGSHLAFSAAVLFFLVGHAMESGILMLELYFEHRNYLPAALLFWPAALLLTRPGRYRRWGVIALAGFMLACATFIGIQARLWGEPARLAETWAVELPESPRAQAYAASLAMHQGRPDLAIARLTPLVRQSPEETQFAINLLDATCLAGDDTGLAVDSARIAIAAQSVSQDLVHQWLASTLAGNGHCTTLDLVTLREFVIAATVSINKSQAKPELHARVERLQALLALRAGDCSQALLYFNARLDTQRRPEFAHEQTGLMATRCGADFGLAHLRWYLAGRNQDYYPMPNPALRLRDRIIARQGMWEDEWKRLEKVLMDDIDQKDRARVQAPLPALPNDPQ